MSDGKESATLTAGSGRDTRRLLRRRTDRPPRMPVGSTARVGSSRSQTEVGKAGVAVRAAAQGPAVFAIRFANGHVVDARVTPGHETVGGELPVLVAVRSVPLPAVIVPLVVAAERDPVLVERPQLLDQPIFQLPVPRS